MRRGHTTQVTGWVSLIPTGKWRDASRRLRLVREAMRVDLACAILPINLMSAGTRSQAVRGPAISRTRIVWPCRGTRAILRGCGECPRKEERHAVFPRLQAGPCRWFRVVILASIPASVAVGCEASPEAAAISADSLAEAAISAGPLAGAAISGEVEAVVADTSAAEEATGAGKKIRPGQRRFRVPDPEISIECSRSRRLDSAGLRYLLA